MRLTQKQEMFCLNYIKTGNATQSAILAKYKPRNADVIASQNLGKLSIIERISELRKKAEDASIMSVIERKQRLSEIARAKLTDYMELGQDGSWVNIGAETPNGAAIQEIHSRTEYDNDGAHPTVYTSVKLHDPHKAIDLLNKMEGVYQAETPPVNNQVNVKVETKIVQFNSGEVARAVLEAHRLGITPEILGGNGHGKDASLLPASTDIQTTVIPESQN
jgi:phage terminase small subunit